MSADNGFNLTGTPQSDAQLLVRWYGSVRAALETCARYEGRADYRRTRQKDSPSMLARHEEVKGVLRRMM